MKIQALSNQNFGRIYIDPSMEKRLDAAILTSSYGDYETKEAITDMLKIIPSKTNDVYVKADGSVLAKGEITDMELSHMGTNDLAANFFMALRVARPDKHMSFLRNFKENFFHITDV
ncbi:MAG: hypothetical protein MJ180_03640 [Candidatus Gastranaerophilales bacterium]|nr:hypothetical protein [Candidatus Gastranaerophilales bacterium]